MYSDNGVRQERSGWRDMALSERHREWGFDCPMVDIDFLVVEYDSAKAKAIIEYKHELAKPANPKDASYRALRNLANKAQLPFFAVRYTEDFSNFLVVPLNKLAKSFLAKREDFDELDFVSFLYRLRGRSIPWQIREKLRL